jgi:uncharacterized protein (TIGR02466 family)
MVYSTKVHDSDEMCAHLLKAIREEMDSDTTGIERSNYRSLGGWHSHNSLHKDARFKILTDRLNRMGDGISKNLGYNPNYRLEVTTMWAISNPPGSSNRAHIHPGAIWSGVIYLQAPEGAGKIEFTDPRTAHTMNQPQFKANTRRSKENWTKVKITPQAGKILMFPAWLYHAVEPNLAKETGPEGDRIVIAFNINQRRIRK